jgi:hypothetical protein
MPARVFMEARAMAACITTWGHDILGPPNRSIVKTVFTEKLEVARCKALAAPASSIFLM